MHRLEQPPDLLIFIDAAKAAKDGLQFYAHQNPSKPETVLTQGMDGTLDPKYFRRVVDPTTNRVLYQAPDDPEVTRQNEATQAMPSDLVVHGTYFENLFDIYSDGRLRPGANPKSYHRQHPNHHHIHTSLLHGDFSQRMERRADLQIVVDVAKLREAGRQVYPHLGDPNTLLVRGEIPRECIKEVRANDPNDLPADLAAKVVQMGEFESIPVIDLSMADEVGLVAVIGHACENIGFFQVVGHGLGAQVFEEAISWTKKLFELPLEEKRRCWQKTNRAPRGWFGKGDENLDAVGEGLQQHTETKRVDAKEGWDFGREDSERLPSDVWSRPSLWPDETVLPGFRTFMTRYHGQLSMLARRLMSLIARSLGLSTDYFVSKIDNPLSTLRLLHYWTLTDFEEHVSAGAHTDYGCCTILSQDQIGGLQACISPHAFGAQQICGPACVLEKLLDFQVLNRSRQWIHVPPIRGALVINLGDMLSRWTNLRYKRFSVWAPILF